MRAVTISPSSWQVHIESECLSHTHTHMLFSSVLYLGIPSPPITPIHYNNTCLCANVSWSTPKFDGDAPITNFTITLTLPAHTLPNSSLSVDRVEIAPANATQIDVCDLRPNAVYNTTITSHNDVGSSRAEEFVILINATGNVPSIYSNSIPHYTCLNSLSTLHGVFVLPLSL